jgi:hypothetical protein
MTSPVPEIPDQPDLPNSKTIVHCCLNRTDLGFGLRVNCLQNSVIAVTVGNGLGDDLYMCGLEDAFHGYQIFPQSGQCMRLAIVRLPVLLPQV